MDGKAQLCLKKNKHSCWLLALICKQLCDLSSSLSGAPRSSMQHFCKRHTSEEYVKNTNKKNFFTIKINKNKVFAKYLLTNLNSFCFSTHNTLIHSKSSKTNNKPQCDAHTIALVFSKKLQDIFVSENLMFTKFLLFVFRLC